jgi:hypothetical protein
MTMYSVSASYEYSTITVGVEVDSDDEVVIADTALDLMAEEWGAGVHDYSDITVEEIN